MTLFIAGFLHAINYWDVFWSINLIFVDIFMQQNASWWNFIKDMCVNIPGLWATWHGDTFGLQRVGQISKCLVAQRRCIFSWFFLFNGLQARFKDYSWTCKHFLLTHTPDSLRYRWEYMSSKLSCTCDCISTTHLLHRKSSGILLVFSSFFFHLLLPEAGLIIWGIFTRKS